jgi:site-specific DNA-methyltransferase (adenine-specific)
MWVYGSGFPKSLSISKAIDQKLGAEREIIGRAKGVGKQNPQWNGTAQGRKENSLKSEYDETIPATESAKLWDGYGTDLKPGYEPIILCKKPNDGTYAENVLKWGAGALNIDGCRIGSDTISTHSRGVNSAWPKRPGEKSAKTDQRLGIDPTVERSGRFPSNLLFSHHPECKVKGVKKVKGSLCNKPSDCKTGTGATGKWGTMQGNRPPRGIGDEDGNETIEDFDCHKDCPVKHLNDQAGIRKSGIMRAGQQRQDSKGKGGYHGGFPDTATENGTYGDSGNCSRFFSCFAQSNFDTFKYCAKASPFERSVGLSGETQKVNDGRQTPIDNPFQRGESERLNIHPTVKPLELVRWLTRLLKTPERGIVLDPFMGSGSTGMAAILEDMDFIGMENVKEYKDIADQRIAFVKCNKALILAEGLKPEIVKKVRKPEVDGLKKVFG